MSTFKCKMCGGTLEIQSGSTVAECEYCGAKQTLPKLDDEKRANLYDRANHFRRSNEFDKATAIYEQILNEDGTDAEAYWSLVLCHYGIEYVEDPLSHRRVPTVHRAQFTSIFDDDNYKLALENADSYQRIIYEEEAKAINEIQKGILAISQKEEPFDVFICYKETDANGKRTHDSVLANDLYYQLKQEGFKVFFARITLEDKLGSAYEPYIFAALNSAKVMVVLGTKPEYFNAVWVRNEWSRFLSLIKRGEQKMLIPAYRDMDPYDLPKEFSHLQAQDMSKLGFMQDLIRGIKKILGKDKKSTETITERVIVNNEGHDIAPILRRTFLFLEDGNFDSADEYAEKVLDINPECAEAYVAKLLIELEMRKPADLASAKTPISDSPNYQKAIRFATPEYRETIEGYNNAIIKRIDTARKDEVYARGVELMKLHRYDEAVQYFQKIPSYKDSTQKIEDCKKLKETERLDGIYSRAMQAMNAGQFDEAASLFTSISDYKDAKEKVKLCGEKKETARKDAIYSAAMQRILPKNADDVAIKKSIEELHTISGYRDVDDQIRALNTRLEKWYEDKKNAEEAARVRAEEERRTREREAELRRLKAEATKKKVKKVAKIGIPSVIALATLLVLLFTLVIPLIRYNQADKLFNEGKYDEAMEIYQDIGGFSESEQRIAVLNAIEKIDDTKFEDGIKEILAAGVPVKLTYGMGGGDFSGTTYLSAPQNDANDGIMLLSASNTSDIMPLASTSDVPETTEFTYNSAADFTGIQTPGRNGYRFVKWELDTYNYQVEGTFEIKLNAVWSTKDYTVDYDLAEGKINGKNVVEYDPEDEAFTLINPTRTGYTFAGWVGTDLSEPTINVTVPTGSYGDRTYTATWTANEYTVTYDAAGGTVSSATQTVAYDSNVEYLIPERAGYTFLGWYENNTKHENEKWTRTSDLTLVAKWDIIGYTISYEMNDGTNHGENPTSYKVDTDTITLKDPSRTGYTFTGWTYEGQTTPTKDVTIEKGSVGNKTFTANWEAITTTITFNANSGVCSTTELSATYDQEFTLPEVTRSGYTFLGWFNNGTKYESGTWKNYTNMELTAEWEIISYSITYELAGGTNALGNPATYTVDQTVILEFPTRTGYTFLGWTYEGQTTPTKDVTIANGSIGEKTYTANWEAISSTITLNPNGGTCDPITIPVTYDQEFTLPDCVWAGHTFSGWYMGDTKVVSGVCKFDKDTTLVAEWDVVQYTISYTMNGGTNDPINPNSYNYHDTITLAEPTRVGYTFVGWTFAGQNTPTKEVTIVVGTTGDKAYTANWSANTYTITFNANSGSVTPSTLDAIFDTNTVLPTPTRTGYKFDGWYNGTTKYTTGTWKHDGDITLTAKWTANSYKASYNADGGTVSNSYKNYTFDASYTLLTPTRTGYEFLGWYNGDKLVPQSGVWTFDSDISLKAKWQAKTYTVTFDAGVGTSSMLSAQATYDSNFTLATAERVGYTFDGWYYNEIKYSSGAWKTDESITLTAKWTARKDIAYVVNHHQQNANDNGYTIVSTENLKGTADATITPSVKTFTHFISPSAKTVTIAPNGSLVVDYYYDRVTYDLTYVTNGGETIEKQTYKYDQTLVIATPTRAGYTFGGWFNDKNLQNAYSATATLNEDTTIYAYWTEENKPSDFNYSGSSAINIDSYIGSDTTVVVPYYIGGNRIVSISSGAFANNVSITYVELPDTLTLIGTGIFEGCSALSEVKAPLSVGGESGLSYAITNDTSSPWIMDANGILKSTNTSHSSKSSYSIVAVSSGTITIQYSASSEANYDKLIIYKNGTEIAQASGTENVYKTLSISLEAGDTVTFTYSKDTSTSTGSDCAYIKGLASAYSLGYLFGENSYDGAIEVTQGQNTYYIPDSLRKVTVTSDVIVDYAFANCVMIEEVQLPSTVGSIGKYAFSGCISLKKLGSTVDGELVVPQSALMIGEYAFQNLLLIEKAVVPDTVTSIGLGAFKGCEGLIDITIPFIGASIDTSNPYNAVFGYIFGYTVYNSTTGAADNSSTLYVNTAYGSAEGTVWQYTCQNYYYDWYGPGGGYAYRSYYYYIPTSIRKVSITMQTSIPVAAFSNCDFIEEINIPDNTIEIGEYAFQNCRSLNRMNSEIEGEVHIPSQIVDIKQYAFINCEQIVKLNLSEKLEGIGAYAFNACAQLTDIEFAAGCNLETIGNYAFADCVCISELQLPTTVTSIGDYAFSGCISIIKVNSNVDGEMLLPENVTTIDEYAFENLLLIEKVIIPDTATSIGNYAFKGCNAIKDITLPFVGKNVDSTARFNSIFGTVPNTLVNIVITSDTTIPSSAFSDLSTVESIAIPASVTSIGDYAFQNCSALKRLNSITDGFFNIPTGVTEIKQYTFKNCVEMTKVLIPAKVINIDAYAFNSCAQLTDIEFAMGCKLETIGNYAFDDCVSIPELQLPITVTSIGNYAFSGCISVTKINNETDGEMRLPENVTTIGDYAFQNLLLIEKVVVPDTVTSIGLGAFKGCEAIEAITVPFIGRSMDATAYNAVFGYIFGYIQHNDTSGGADDSSDVYINKQYGTKDGIWQYSCKNYYYDWYGPGAGYSYRSYYYCIPTTIKNVTITAQTEIPIAAFNNCSFIETITLPTTVTSIGEYAFQNYDANVSQTYVPKFSCWNGTDVSTSFLGSGTEADPYQINNAADLACLASSVNAGTNYAGKYFVLNVDINLNSKSWTPIGTKANPFAGTFDGNGKEIYNISVTMDTAYAGLFGYVSGTVKGLGIVSGTIAPASTAASTYVGGLVGYLIGTVENCYSQATINVNVANIVYAGGLIGQVDSVATVKDSYASGNVSVTTTSGFAYAGGFVGMNKGTIEGSLAFGNVTAHGQSDSYSRNGGFAAKNDGTLTECYRSETQVLTKYTSAGSAYCDDGTSDSYSDMIAYAQTNWASTVWEFDHKYPNHK